jgi:hypothetical protein
MGELREVERMSIKIAEPTRYTWVCSHGNKLNEKCFQCDVQRAREIVRQWGDYVDESRMVIAEAELEGEKG